MTKRSKSSSEPSQRQLRVGEQIRHVLAEVLSRRELGDKFLDTVVVTVSEVSCSPDLKNATAFVTILGGGDTQALLAALQRVKYILKRHLASQLELKHTPDINFQHDCSFDEAERISHLLNSPRVQQDLNKGKNKEEASSASDQMSPNPADDEGQGKSQPFNAKLN